MKNWIRPLLMALAAFFGGIEAGETLIDPGLPEDFGLEPAYVNACIGLVMALVAGKLGQTEAWVAVGEFLTRFRISSALTPEEQREQLELVRRVERAIVPRTASPPTGAAKPPAAP
jgi:hypothetical protein